MYDFLTYEIKFIVFSISRKFLISVDLNPFLLIKKIKHTSEFNHIARAKTVYAFSC